MTILALALLAGWATGNPAQIAKGKEIYEVACLLCHGNDGSGNPEWESKVRPASFANCGSTAEPTALWTSVVANGGEKHGLADSMPAFGEAFPPEDLAAVVTYLRTFCKKADHYPPGDLNFRRTLGVAKAFPEAEFSIAAKFVPYEGETELEFSYENRIGPRLQYEIEAPVRPLVTTEEKYPAGLQDISLSAKYVLAFNAARLSILSGGLKVSLPNGNDGKLLGSGTTVFTPFLLYGKGFKGGAIQARIGVDLPVNTLRAARNYQYALAYSFPAIGFSRTGFVPAVEFLGAFNDRSHQKILILGVSKALSRLGHVTGSAGLAIPLRPEGAFSNREYRAYLLWDFADGPFWRGW